MTNRLGKPIALVDHDAFLAYFWEGFHQQILTGLSRPGVSAAVCFESLPYPGRHCCLFVGPRCVHSLDDIDHIILGQPDNLAYPIAIWIRQ